MKYFFIGLKYSNLLIENQKETKHIFNKKNQLLDLFISFAIVITVFCMIGLLFGILDNVRYLFYMILFAVNASYIVMITHQELEYKRVLKYKEHILVAISRDLLLSLQQTLMVGLVIMKFIYTPFFGIIDQIILLVFLVIISSIIIYFDFGVGSKQKDTITTLFSSFLIVLLYMYILFVIPRLSNATTFLLPTGIVLVLLIAHKYYLSINIHPNTIYFQIAFRSVILTLISILTLFYVHNYIDGDSLSLPMFYVNAVEREYSCSLETKTNTYNTTDQFKVEDYIIINSYNMLKVVDYDSCTTIESRNVPTNSLLYKLDGEVYFLEQIEVAETLNDGYKAYRLSQFVNNQFVEVRVFYEYGVVVQELFPYNGLWAYSTPYYYEPNQNGDFAFIQYFTDESNYGIDVNIVDNGILYQDMDMAIVLLNTNTFLALSNHYNSYNFRYSGGYLIYDYYANEDYDEYDINSPEGIIVPLEDFFTEDTSRELEIQTESVDFNYWMWYAQYFEYRNNLFYIVIDNYLVIISKEGTIVQIVDNVSNDIIIDENQFYLINYQTINTISLDNPNSYQPMVNIHRGDEIGFYELNVFSYDEFIIHDYSIGLDYFIVFSLILIIVSPSIKELIYSKQKKSIFG